jgi:hypothetical protein
MPESFVRSQPVRRVLSYFTFFMAASGVLGLQGGCGEPLEAPAEAAMAPQAAASTQALAAACDLSGEWGMRLQIPVQWSGSLGIRSGRGTMIHHVRLQRRHNGQRVEDRLQVCGVQLPDYTTTALAKNERFGVRFPASLFAREDLPTFPMNYTIDEAVPGASFQTDYLAIQMGVEMERPIDAPWPKLYTGLQPILDADHDGYPGVAVEFDQGPGYSNPPINWSGSIRADKIFTAFRNVARLSGTYASCDRIVGAGEVPQIERVFALNAHALGCLKLGGGECTPKETLLLDRFQPIYRVTGPSVLHMQRLPGRLSCEAVRALDFDQ